MRSVILNTGKPIGVSMKKAYIDIETNYVGKKSEEDPEKKFMNDHENHLLTIVGIYLVDGDKKEVIQLVGDECTKENILNALNGVGELVTYNGRSKRDHIYGYTGFDFPVIHAQTGLLLDEGLYHTDLSVVCWEKGLKGGLKKIEKKLGIEREDGGIRDGKEAMKMWREYKRTGDLEILERLKAYNREDIVNLVLLEQKLAEY